MRPVEVFRTAVRLFRARNALTGGVPQAPRPVPGPDAVTSSVPRSVPWRTIFRFVLTVAGLGLLTAGTWNFSPALGLAAAGVSCLVVEWTLTDGPRR